MPDVINPYRYRSILSLTKRDCFTCVGDNFPIGILIKSINYKIMAATPTKRHHVLKTIRESIKLMKLDFYLAKKEYLALRDKFQGEILGLSGGADFYGSSPDQLRIEIKDSLDVILKIFWGQGIEPRKQFSGKFILRLSP